MQKIRIIWVNCDNSIECENRYWINWIIRYVRYCRIPLVFVNTSTVSTCYQIFIIISSRTYNGHRGLYMASNDYIIIMHARIYYSKCWRRRASRRARTFTTRKKEAGHLHTTLDLFVSPTWYPALIRIVSFSSSYLELLLIDFLSIFSSLWLIF